MNLRAVLMAITAAAVATAPASARVPRPLETIELPPSRQKGLDMIMIDAEAMPEEPELARNVPEIEDVSWSGSAIDLLKPIHHLYTDLRRQLVRYQQQWSGLPQVRIPTEGGLMVRGSTDPRVAILRERLGLSHAGGFDEALHSKLAEYQKAHGLDADGKAGAQTLASLNRGALHYERVILLNMERARRLPPSDMKGRYILVDAGSARLWMYENGRAVDSMKVIVGGPESETPMMAALMRYASVNPYWNVPPDLVQKTIAPRVLSEGLSYLADRRYEVLDGWHDDARVIDPATVNWGAVAARQRDLRVRQLPGAGNFMGEIKFMMPNEYGIYLHDTPGKVLFDQDDRWLSNGCVRVEDARRLAGWLFGRMPRAASPNREEDVELGNAVPVYITYLTVGTSAEGPSFRADRYDRDAPVLARLAPTDDGMIEPDLAAIQMAPAPAPVKASAVAVKAPAPAATKAASAPAAKKLATAPVKSPSAAKPAAKPGTPTKSGSQSAKTAEKKTAAKSPPSQPAKKASATKAAAKPPAAKTIAAREP